MLYSSNTATAVKTATPSRIQSTTCVTNIVGDDPLNLTEKMDEHGRSRLDFHAAARALTSAFALTPSLETSPF